MFKTTKSGFSALSSVLVFSAAAFAQSRSQVAQGVDENRLVSLAGNTRPEANKANDRGLMADNTPIRGMFLQLRRSPLMEQAAADFVDSLYDRNSPNFHHWLTAAQFGEKFGVAEQDIDRVTSWLRSHGFSIDAVSSSRMQIAFSGSVSAVQEAFHTEMHNLSVNGEPHFANLSDPKIPEALAPVISGITSLHNFMPKPLNQRVSAIHAFNVGSGYNVVAPSDLAEIYNLNPLFKAGITGKGISVAVVEDTDIYSYGDFRYFRKEMGLSRLYPAGNFTLLHPGPGPAGTCGDPGINGNEFEATLDAEWASASAPNASIEMLSCADTDTNFGGFIALQNILSVGPVPQIVSISYAESETLNGSAGNAYIYSLYQQAAAQGVSLFAASGDWGAAVTDVSVGDTVAEFGVNVSALASTRYNVAVGGTDFSDAYFGTTSKYWSGTDGPNHLSAKSYVPEVPWNDSCAGTLLTSLFGYAAPYGAKGFCNSKTASSSGFLNIISGSGGPSACAKGTPAYEGVVSGTCAGWEKPGWQSVYGNPNDKVRDLPDVSLFASNGFLYHYYIVCDSYDQTCFGDPANWPGAGGTSFASPIMAGMQALINQKAGSYQGNPNPVYYALADIEYGAHGNASCNSSLGNAVSAKCAFYDVTEGDMDLPCETNMYFGKLFSCYDPSGTYGVLSTSDKAYEPAFAATPGWDFANGLGTVNLENLATQFADYVNAAKHPK